MAVLNIFHDKTLDWDNPSADKEMPVCKKNGTKLRSKPFIKDTNAKLHKHTL